MGKKVIWGLIILIIFELVGCSTDNRKVIYNMGPIKTTISGMDATVKFSINIYHDNNFVTKIEETDEYKLSENGHTEELKKYAESIEDIYNQDMFKVVGFGHLSQLNDTSFTSEITIDYTKVKFNDLSDEIKVFFYGSDLDLLDKDHNVLYDKMIDYYKKNGFGFAE